MTAWLDEDGVLHVASESTMEMLALRGWVKEYAIQNVNGVLMFPSRGLVCHQSTMPDQTKGDKP